MACKPLDHVRVALFIYMMTYGCRKKLVPLGSHYQRNFLNTFSRGFIAITDPICSCLPVSFPFYGAFLLWYSVWPCDLFWYNTSRGLKSAYLLHLACLLLLVPSDHVNKPRLVYWMFKEDWSTPADNQMAACCSGSWLRLCKWTPPKISWLQPR